MSEFKMPVAGTPEFDSLKARWSAKPVTFGQCGRIKAQFKLVNEAGGYVGKVNAKFQTRLDYISTRDENGRWTNLRTDNADLNMTMWQAHLLMETLESLVNAEPVTVTKTQPKAKPVKVDPESVKAKSYADGDYIVIDGVTRRISLNGKRAYLAAV